MKIALHKDLDEVDALLDNYFPLVTTDEEISIRVGPTTIKARIPRGFREDLMPRYQGFLWEGECDFLVDVARDDALGEPLLYYRDIFVLSKPSRKVHYVFRWDFIARIDTENKYVCLLIAPIGPPVCVDSIFRVAVSFAAVDKGGLLLHAAAIASPHGGFLFCGTSGSGKSTVAQISKEWYDVMTDEMALIEKVDNGYRVWGTPFWGQLQMSVNKSAPLRAALLLSKASSSSIQDVSLTWALPKFMETILYFGQNLETADVLLNVTMDFLEKVPIKNFSFQADKTLWKVILDKFGK